MNTIKTISACAFIAFAAAVIGPNIDRIMGPSDLQAAQDVADDARAAQIMASQAAECKRRYGADADVFLLEGQHTVCRAKTKLAGAKP